MVDAIQTQLAYAPNEAASEGKANGAKEFSFFGDNGFTFLDFVDMINPLQHIPIVSTAYREITGDELDPGARLAGDTLYGGPIGLAASVFNVVLEHNTGKDVGEHVVAWFDGDEQPADSQTMIAENQRQANPNVASFAPLPANYPESEADALAAGEASLRLAELQNFMNPSLAEEVPLPTGAENGHGSGSIGSWSPPENANHPFPLERPRTTPVEQPLTTSFQRYQAPVNEQNQPAVEEVAKAKQYTGFQAQQSHEETLDALQAFARDMQAQKAQMQAAEAQKQVAPPQPIATRTSELSQTQNNAWFADMMSQNYERYENSPPKS